MIAKFFYDSENSAVGKIEIFAMIEIFAIIAKFHYHSENFAIIAKILLSLRNFRYACEIANLPSCILRPALCIFHLAISSSQAS